MATAESAQLALLSHLVKSAERFCALKDVFASGSKLGSGSARSFALACDQVFYF